MLRSVLTRLAIATVFFHLAPGSAFAIDVCGPIPAGTTWSLADSPVQVRCDLSVAELTVDAGVEILMDEGVGIEVAGILRILGTRDYPVTIKPAPDNPSGWRHISFQDTPPGSEINWAVIEGATDSALRLIRSSPEIRHVTFRANAAEVGGAIYAEIDEDLLILNSVFENNHAALIGAGVYVTGPATPGEATLVVTESLFRENTAGTSSTQAHVSGGGLYVNGNSRITRTAFFSNTTVAYTIYAFGGRFVRGSGAFLASGFHDVIGSVFVDNTAKLSAHSQTPDGSRERGAGIYLASGELMLTNSLLARNTLPPVRNHDPKGSALFVNSGVATVINTTVADNDWPAIYRAGGELEILNSIVYDNLGPDQIIGTTDVTYSLIQGGHDGESNLDLNPILDHNYVIRPPSPAIDACHPSFTDVVPPGQGSAELCDLGWTGGMHAAFAPVPDAGADFSMDERATGMLDGSASFDLDGNPLRYSWLQIGGPPVVLFDRNAASPTFVAPQVAISETLLFELRLRNEQGNYSYADTVQVTVNSAPYFSDVPENHWAFSQIEAIADLGVTGGCGNGNYCGNDVITRAQMAVFLLRAKYGAEYAPPPPTGVFVDVPVNHWAAAWIEQFAAEGITSGCGHNSYCPSDSVTRAQMAVFLLRAKYGAEYAPPPPTGLFVDVPVNHWAAAWIEQLAAEGITSGCGNNNFCPSDPVTRAQMAVFLVNSQVIAPVTSISNGPASLTNATGAMFSITSSAANASFMCSLDSSEANACTSPVSFAGLLEGPHTFTVWSIDPSGLADLTPATYNWLIDLTPPDTSIVLGPPNRTDTPEATFNFASTEPGSTFACSLDGGPYLICAAPHVYSGITEGHHTVDIRATDAAGNTDPSQATHTWAYDVTPPVVSVPIGIRVSADDASGAPATRESIQAFLYGATAVDAVDGNLTAGIVNDAPAIFPIGLTTVTFSVLDIAGNIGSNTATVEVIVDTEAPHDTSVVINEHAHYALPIDLLHAALSAADNVGTTAYLVTEHNATDPANVQPPYLDPLASDGRWVAVPETAEFAINIPVSLQQDYEMGDTVELCAWFMDYQSNISNRVCDSIVYGVDWESGWGNWGADNGVWQVGSPTAGPAECFSGTQCAATNLDGNYDAYADSRLISPSVTLPALTGDAEHHLRFMHWFSYHNSDKGQVQISIWDSEAEAWGDWIDEGVAVANNSGWSLKDVDLTGYAGQTIRVAFLHVAHRALSYVADESTGWYIDDIRIETATPEFSGSFEAGWPNWGAEGGVWQAGAPSNGPASCYTGSQCAGTELDSNYGAYTDSRLVSATITLPATSGAEETHVRFMNWFSYAASDSGQVQVSVRDGATGEWGTWIDVGSPVTNTSCWSLKDVDLTAFAGETVRIGFFHKAGRALSYVADESSGWYIDDVEIVTATPTFSGSFETGWNGWGAGSGVWQVGLPTTGPGGCYAGSQCAGTELHRNYGPYTDSRLIGSTVVLPVVTGPSEIHLRFQNWFSYHNSDSGQVQVSVRDDTTGEWGPWTDEGVSVVNSSGWSLKDVDLTAYSGATVRIAFFHVAGRALSYVADESAGWFIDDIVIEVF